MLRTDGGDRGSAGGTTDNDHRGSADSARDGLRRGDTLARRYELDRPAGKGGMGAVWVARDRVLDIEVAVKVIRRDARVPGAEARLLTEARAAARLGHPAVVRVLDFGKTDLGDPFMAMELLEGETLAALLAREKRLSATRAVQMLLPVIDGLAALHAKQIIHRDLKPDNIYLARDEAARLQPKIVDFGIAKLEQRGPLAAITHCGEVLGSPAYMSPEQARGLGGLDHRTDIWSLCVVLFELVAGSRPFVAKNYNALLRAIIERPPAELPASAGDKELQTIILAGLRKEKDERWGSMRELGEALALWLYERGVREDICASCIRTAWLEAGLEGVKVDIPPSIPTLRGALGKRYSPRIIDAAALAATERQRRPSAASEIPSASDGLKEMEVIEQMRKLLGTGSTTESDGGPAPEGEEALAEEKEQHAYTKTASDSKRPAADVYEPKLLKATGTRRRGQRVVAAVITCTVMAAAGAWVGLLGDRAGPAESKAVELGASGATFASTQAARATDLSSEGTKPAVVEAAETKPAVAEEARTEAAAAAQQESALGAAQASRSPAPSEQRKVEAQGSRSKEKAGTSGQQTSGAPKKGAPQPRKAGGDDFNFGF